MEGGTVGQGGVRRSEEKGNPRQIDFFLKKIAKY
jgi:hypothetical protein